MANSKVDTILLVDTWPVVTAGLAVLMQNAGIKHTVKQAHTVEDAVHALSNNLALLILDPTMPCVTPDMLVTLARRKQAELPIVFFSSQPYGIHLPLAHTLGVNGYLDKASDTATLLAAIQMVLTGMQCFPHQDASSPESVTTLQELSSRELTVLCMLRQGLRNKDIAERLYLSPKTVSSHKRNVLRKLGVGQVVLSAFENDLAGRDPDSVGKNTHI